MINSESEIRKIDSMIDRIPSLYASEFLNKSVIGVINVSDIVANYVTIYKSYPDEKTIALLIETVEDSLQDRVYDYVIRNVDSIIQNIENVD